LVFFVWRERPSGGRVPPPPPPPPHATWTLALLCSSLLSCVSGFVMISIVCGFLQEEADCVLELPDRKV
jgi:hypothetical protein